MKCHRRLTPSLNVPFLSCARNNSYLRDLADRNPISNYHQITLSFHSEHGYQTNHLADAKNSIDTFTLDFQSNNSFLKQTVLIINCVDLLSSR